MAESIYKRKGNFKGFLFVLGLLLIAVILAYTQHLVNILQQKSSEYLSFRVKVFEENINNPNANIELGFFFNEVIQGSDYPIIYSDTLMVPQSWINIDAVIDTLSETTPEIKLYLQQQLVEMDRENKPIPIKYQGITLGYYHYGVSPVIRILRMLPYFEIAAAALFILIGYLGFSQIKKSEQRYIWVGMAKETAHQLGTPLSSINGWLEILGEDDSTLPQALREMEVDTKRLNKIAQRFSQIGSNPSLKNRPILPVLQLIVDYFQKRLPHISKKVTIRLTEKNNPLVALNADLFEWVIENLIKNALDAIESNGGFIELAVLLSPDQKHVFIDVRDSGKGISSVDRKNIFKPGFSTKKRGWGLGLSLAKRIVEDYHGGKLYVKESRLGEGSRFRIVLSNKSSSNTNLA